MAKPREQSKSQKRKRGQKPVSQNRAQAKRKPHKYFLPVSTIAVVVIGYIILYSTGWLTQKFSDQTDKAQASLSKERLPFPPPPTFSPNDEPTFDDFVGSDACANCHSEQYQKWKGSTHGRAGGAPTSKRIISKFNNEPLRFMNAVVTPVNKNGKFVFMVEQEGFPKSLKWMLWLGAAI